MSIWNLVSRDILIDSFFGDIELVNNDVVVSTKPKDILKNVVIERYKTNYGDFILDPNSGAGLDKYVGKGLDKNLADNVATQFRYALTYDNFISNEDLEIYTFIINNVLHIQTYIQMNNEVLTINATFDSEGVFEID